MAKLSSGETANDSWKEESGEQREQSPRDPAPAEESTGQRKPAQGLQYHRAEKRQPPGQQEEDAGKGPSAPVMLQQ